MMSRCLPFPPALTNRGSYREALIKLQKEKDETKTERRREKELKKQSRKEHKVKEKKAHTSVANEKVQKLSDEKKYHKHSKSKADLYAGYPPTSVGYESEQLERSDITEEHDQPSCSGSVCNVLDSIDSSNKRKRQDDPAIATENRSTILRIRLPLRKHSEPNPSAIDQINSCPAKGSEINAQEGKKEHICQTKAETKAVDCKQLSLKPHVELSYLASEEIETSSAKSTYLYLNKKQRAVLAYKTLIEDWIPDPLSRHGLGQSESDDEDWLFGSKSQLQRLEPKRQKTGNDASCSRSSSLWPQATYLSEVDTFALPYTVPY